MAARALERNRGDRDGLGKVLAGLGRVPGVTGDIVMDSFGDVERPLFCTQCRRGRFVTLEESGD